MVLVLVRNLAVKGKREGWGSSWATLQESTQERVVGEMKEGEMEVTRGSWI